MSRRALFVSVPLTGHLAPLLQEARELARRGWQVRIASTEEARRHVANHDELSFVSLGSAEKIIPSLHEVETYATLEPDFLKSSVAMIKWAHQLWPIMYDGALKEEIREYRPDVIIADIVSMSGIDAAETEGIPIVINNPCVLTAIPIGVLPPANDVPMLFSGDSIHRMGVWQKLTYPMIRTMAPSIVNASLGRDLNRLRDARGLPPVDYARRLAGVMVLTNTAFGFEYARPLSSLQYLVGPLLSEADAALPAEFAQWLDGGPPVVFVNMGTIAAPSTDVLKRLLSGLTFQEYRVLWVLRPPCRKFLPATLPHNVRVEPWVPSQLGVLLHENVCAFVSHCGANSAHESMFAGKPVVGIPMLADQKDIAQRIVDAGAGVMLDKTDFTPEQLKSAIFDIVQDKRFTRCMPGLRDVFKAAGGMERAADLIEQTARVPPVGHLVLYDGVCGLCNWTVRFLIGIDPNRIINFAPLQGATAKEVLGRHRDAPKSISTMAYIRNAGRVNEQVYYKSDAELEVLRDIGGVWFIVSWLKIIPRFIRDWVYDCVAANRYVLFGKYESCPMPDASLRERFLS